MTDLTLIRKYRIVKSYGTITRQRDNKFQFKSYSFRDSPVLEMTHKSQWKLVIEVFDLINELE